MKRLLDLDYLRLIKLTALILGYTVAGGLLAAFSAPGWVWLGTLAVTLHLAKAGSEAIVLANAWILTLIFIAVLQKIWPLFLGGYLPKSNAPLWAILMILLWFFAIGLVWLLGETRQRIQATGFSSINAFWRVLALSWISLGFGCFIIQKTLF